MTTYRDPLGRLQPRASVAPLLGRKSEWTLSAVSDAPDMRWPEDTPVETILAALDAAGWDTEITYPHHGYPPHIQATHRETAAALAAETITLTGDGEDGYIRYGDIPSSGRSINHVTNEPELGVSVYRATYYDNGYEVSTPHYSTGTYESIRAQGRPVYRVWGEVLGTGSDGEPVVAVKKIKRIG